MPTPRCRPARALPRPPFLPQDLGTTYSCVGVWQVSPRPHSEAWAAARATCRFLERPIILYT